MLALFCFSLLHQVVQCEELITGCDDAKVAWIRESGMTGLRALPLGSHLTSLVLTMLLSFLHSSFTRSP